MRVAPEAVALLLRSLRIAGLDPKHVGIRLRPSRSLGGSTDVQVEFVDEPAESDIPLLEGDIKLYADAALLERFGDGIVAVSSEHERVVVEQAPSKDAL